MSSCCHMPSQCPLVQNLIVALSGTALHWMIEVVNSGVMYSCCYMPSVSTLVSCTLAVACLVPTDEAVRLWQSIVVTVCVGRDPKSGNPELFLPNRVTVRGETNYPWVVSNFGMVCTLINDISPRAAVHTVHIDKSRLPVEQYTLCTLISHVSPRAAVHTVHRDKSHLTCSGTYRDCTHWQISSPLQCNIHCAHW